jgi:putative ABC transport system permease protein
MTNKPKLLWLSGWRHLLRHPLQILFAVVGVALGVAVVVSIDLAVDSSRRAFQLSAETLAGQATHQVVGGPGGLADETYRRLRVEATVRPSAPIVEGYAEIAAHPGRFLRILGIDPFVDEPFRTYTPAPEARIDIAAFLTRPNTGLMTADGAAELGVAEGEEILLRVGGLPRTIVLLGTLVPRDEIAARALDEIIVTDIATAQEVLGKPGRLSRIDLALPIETADEQLLRIRDILPPGAEIVPAGMRAQAMDQMTRAFSLNLSALSLLALVVGMFLIYNTMTFSILQRRPLLGTLRTLGVTRREVFGLVVGEALLIGLLGTLLGLLAGMVLGQGLLHLVTRTINDLYFVVAVRQVTVTAASLFKWLSLGLGAAVLTSLVPALEATHAPPSTVLSRSSLETRGRRLVPRAALAGCGILLTGAATLLLPGESIIIGFFSLFALIVGFALLTPALTMLLSRALQPVMKRTFGILGKIAVRDLVASLSRTGVAIAALVIAVSATIGTTVMIGSFRLTVANWLESYLTADIYITTPSAGGRGEGRLPLDPNLIADLAGTPGVTALSLARHVVIESPTGLMELFVVHLPPEGFAGYRFTGGNRVDILRDFTTSTAVLVSEPFAFHNNLRRGDILTLRTDRGHQPFRVAGIFHDYGSDRGRVTISRDIFRQFWNDPDIDAVGLYLESGIDADAVAAQIRRHTSDEQQLLIYSNRGLRELSMATFDQTFAITSVLRMLAVLVAFVGILNALMAMQIERSRELAVLRANGLTPRQLWILVSGETGLIGLIAGLLAVPLGLLQALILIHVINRRSFGWTMQTFIDPGILLQAVVLAVFAALVAGIYPALRMARTSPALSLRGE